MKYTLEVKEEAEILHARMRKNYCKKHKFTLTNIAGNYTIMIQPRVTGWLKEANLQILKTLMDKAVTAMKTKLDEIKYPTSELIHVNGTIR